MAEEQHRCQEQRLCVNNCGFYGSPATENLCSKCYRDLHQSQPLNHQLLNPSSSSSAASVSSFSSPAVDVLKVNTNQKAPVVVVGDDKKDEQQQPNRCLTCRRRVGLTGFKCRCGMVFCGTHRYPEQHDCEFDFKSLGKQQIAKANPVVKGEKLQKI
ncbi:zinc finger A20 and AN1 domain-containing stress-associated protein 3-like [Populus alba x Populus x berolinensis]|uniref:Zinc finger A20 and AN1 domain-containing stress-associated protein 3-like n=1 Tax=Populus alba x Populus x berolinensis TaxID=444605 RepID=A0AAD6W6Y1_9ROSI|nr:zinc finger A20 and AN1 domain-containing stress-associated protein 3-like [Populus alba x Populus x berolinensis]